MCSKYHEISTELDEKRERIFFSSLYNKVANIIDNQAIIYNSPISNN